MTVLRGPIVLVGCGKMGGALLQGWLAAGLEPGEAWVVEPAAGAAVPAGVNRRAAVTELPRDLAAAAIVLAVKPQMMDAPAAALVPWVGARTLVLSIAAGKTLRYFQDRYGEAVAIVRAMPNTPAAVGRGASVLCAAPGADGSARALAQALLAAVGTVDWVEDEALMHAVTAMSGGGPAYVFLLIETLARAGERLGLPAELAQRLARRTVEGSGFLSQASPESPEQLRRNVTSPGGTTQAALAILMGEPGLQDLFDRALAAAAARSRELG
jgi:pyrroline-5-carboxylate reductase